MAVVVNMPRVIRVVRWPTLPVRTDPAGGGTVGAGLPAALAEAPPGAPFGVEAGAPFAWADSPAEEFGALTCVEPLSEGAAERAGGFT